MDFSILPGWLEAAIFVVGTCAVSLGLYALARLLLGKKSDETAQTLAGSVIFRVAGLHSLILALVFAQEAINYRDVRETIAVEASAVADVFYDLVRYHPEDNLALQIAMYDYAQFVVGPEWEDLAHGQLNLNAWAAWEKVYQGVLDLEPTNPRQVALRENMLTDIDVISDSRNVRELAAFSMVSWLFWAAALFGLLLVVISYFTFTPRPIHLMLLSVFAAYNGLVLFFIAAMSSPYAEPAAIDPKPFKRLVENMRDELVIKTQ